MEPDKIVIKGAQQHNLRKVDLALPRNKFVVLTGVSGSGKSSLAFDTIYAEGQRRYVESLSAFARQFIGQMEKPKVDYIAGLSPAIAIEQKTVSKNPRSTVGTVTEILDYLRVLFARAGTPHCPNCGRAVQAQSAAQITRQLAALPAGTKFQLLAPVVRERKGTHAELLEEARKNGFSRARINGVVTELSGSIKLAKTHKHTIEIIVDRLRVPDDLTDEVGQDFSRRLADSVETTLKAAEGVLVADLLDGNEIIMSEQNACAACGISFPELTPQLFSFNSPLGMCPDCNGLGTQLEVDPALILADENISILDGALRWYGAVRKKSDYTLRRLTEIAVHCEADLESAWKDLPPKFQHAIYYGLKAAEAIYGKSEKNPIEPNQGIVHHCQRLFRQTKSEWSQRFYAGFMRQMPCGACEGSRLRKEARGVTVGGVNLNSIGRMAIDEAHGWISNLPDKLDAEQYEIAVELIKEIRDRLQFMLNVGLHYLTLDRPAPTLSGGEGQRIRLASQLGCGLVGVLYILDEPSIGLHPRDNRALLNTLLRLRDMGNTVLVVEHDTETMQNADWLVDMGPGAGVKGGTVVASGTPQQVAANIHSLTGKYLSGALEINVSQKHRRQPKGTLSLHGAKLHNLKNVSAHFPLGVFTCITGVSGGGKSSLISKTLYPALAKILNGAEEKAGPYERIDGLEQLDKVINITQEPIGRTPRSNPATYVGLFDEIRAVFANMPESKTRGYKPNRFSFNVKGGRCEACQGYGLKKVEMHFLADVWVTCRECNGKRFNRETLEIKFRDKTIADVLDMDVQEALEIFANQPKIAKVLQTLHEVGLDYLKLGQSATTLSGGEAQRVKLASELCRPATGRTIYILDEPTTGLHFADVQRLLDVLHRLVDAGNSVVVIEHNLDVIKTADWLIDLGPEGGENGGYIVAEGTPESVAHHATSYTGQFLAELLPAERMVAD
jgi:excinuclease ABC subunit A